jgi:hypothetical protein
MLQPGIAIVEALSDYRLKLYYENGEVRFFDVSPYIRGRTLKKSLFYKI